MNKWHLPEDKYQALPLKERFIMDMMSEYIETILVQKEISSIASNYPWNMTTGEYRESDKIRIQEMKNRFDAGFNTYYVLKHLYESEYGKLTTEREIKKVAKGLAEKLYEANSCKAAA